MIASSIAVAPIVVPNAANSIVSVGIVPDGKRMFAAPKMPCAALLSAMPMPIVAIIGIRCGALRRRSGFSTSTSIRSPTTPATANANGSASASGHPKRDTASTPAYAPTMNTAPCERLMTPEHAEDQREAEREQRVQRAERQPVDELLG